MARLIASAVATALLCWPAAAQEPGPEPATAGTPATVSALREALAAYVTQLPFERGIIHIEPDPAGERVTIDAGPALSELAGSPVRFAPWSFVVSERPDGDWNVFSRDAMEIAADIAIEGARQSFEYRQGSQSFKGIFSPDLAAFRESEAAAGQTVTVQADDVSRSTTSIDAVTLSMTARPGATGGADIDARQTYRDYRQTSTVSFPAPELEGDAPAAPPMSFGFEASAASADSAISMKDGRTRALRDLYALVLRNASALEADPVAVLKGPFGTEFKAALGTVLPVWEALSGEAVARDVAVSSLYGEFAAAEASQTLRFTGVAKDASFEIDTRLTGIRTQSPLLPPWAATLMPEEIALGFAVSGADLRTPADLALAEVDFAQDPPLSPEAQARIAASFDTSRIQTRLKSSRVRAQDFDVAFSGDLRFQGEKPAASITVDATGLDRTIATLQGAAAAQPELHQAIGLLQFAKGVGRSTGTDRLEWVVDAAADGSVTVNGTTVKGPDPVVEEGVPGETPSAPAPESDTQPDGEPGSTEL